MAQPLQGNEFRVFRSLAHEWPFDTVEKIRIELTQGCELTAEEIEAALASLRKKNYLEEFKPGRWKLSLKGYGVRRSLMGEMPTEEKVA